MGLFNFFKDLGNHEERKVDRSEVNGAVIDTCLVSGYEKDFETAVRHKRFNDGNWVVVETYDTFDQSQAGHNKWRQLFEVGLPDELVDVYLSDVKLLGESLGLMDSVFKLN